MNRISKLFILSALLIAISALVIPASAQDDGDGEKVGGIIVDSTFGEGPDTFSQIYCTGTDCADIVGYLYMGLLGVDVEQGVIAMNQPGALASTWEVSDDNLVYTISLREDVTWSDGTPMTANDVIFHWELMNNEAAAHPDAFLLEEIVDVVALDDFTLEFTMANPTCRALLSIGGVTPVPAHVLGEFAPEDLATIDFNLAPDVTSGPYTFGEFRPSEITTLIANDNYIDAELGFINHDGYIQRVFADQTVLIESFLEGDLTFLENPAPDRKSDIRAADVQVYDFAGNTWDYMAFNLADPENPQPALDEEGNRVDQGLHPIFSDVTVRQAISHAVDIDAIVEGAVFGEGSRMAAQITPSSWAYNSDLAPRPYDPELALEMLAEAGWVADDSGQLVCQGCLYAQEVDPEFEGSPLEFELLTNSGNTRREAIGAIIQDELAQIGITVNFQTLEFNTLLEIMDAQTFDAFILGWRAGYPDSPDTIQLFGAEADVPGSGFNFTSFYNEEYYELEEQALNVPGCADEERKPFYDQMQQIMYDEVPYMWLFVQNGMFAAQPNLLNFDPRPQQIDWNIDTWALTP